MCRRQKPYWNSAENCWTIVVPIGRAPNPNFSNSSARLWKRTSSDWPETCHWNAPTKAMTKTKSLTRYNKYNNITARVRAIRVLHVFFVLRIRFVINHYINIIILCTLNLRFPTVRNTRRPSTAARLSACWTESTISWALTNFKSAFPKNLERPSDKSKCHWSTKDTPPSLNKAEVRILYL